MNKRLAKAGFPMLAKNGFQLSANSSVKSSYEAASTSRRMSTWGTSATGPNASSSELSTIRSRSRALVRNNAYATSALNTYVSNLIGTGIKPRWKLDDASLKEELQQLWQDWIEEADFNERTDFYGLLELMARTEFQSGEVFGQFIARPMSAGLAVPFQVKVFEPDHCDATYTIRLSKNRFIINGIEFDSSGKRIAYHFFRQHPSELNTVDIQSGTRVRVLAKDIMHIYALLRPGQVRGVPHVTPVLTKLYEIDQYQDAELVRKKTAAMFAAFITKTAGTPNPTEGGFGDTSSGDTTDEEVPIISLEPGITQYLSEGEDVVFSQPADSGNNAKDWLFTELHAVAVGWGITFEQLTGDLSGVNYTSLRAGLLEFRRRMEMRQANMMIFQGCRPVANRFIDIAIASGAVEISDFMKKPRQYKRVEWRSQGWDWVDPVKDQMGAKMGVRNGWDTREDVAAKRGKDVEHIDKQNAEDRKRARQLELVYDSEPSNTNNAGTLQGDQGDQGDQRDNETHDDEIIKDSIVNTN